MKLHSIRLITLSMCAILILPLLLCCSNPRRETAAERDRRMAWWREARFGMFIHWGLYAIPAGEWHGDTDHAEWIRTTARIPLEEYDRFVDEFNPLQFDAGEWVRIAKAAGMKYIVITSKHHDGFCLFDSRHTDFDIMSTPFQRDVLKELAEACHEQGIKICWYHSIMDWHHPDYLPRREWENRPAEGVDFRRYIAYMKNQLRELIKKYGEIGVLWFDGEWESTWTHEYGVELYEHVRKLQRNIIINNRVDVGRAGMQGLTREGGYIGDFGTPEQEIPATGLPGVDWETCMTMNRHWGWNKHDDDWKSSEDLIQKLADIASKGGNFLLNVGPTAEGSFPVASVERLADIGRWMKINGEAIYGTQASPFASLPWGRCTLVDIEGGTRLYLHVFDWPADGMLKVPGIYNMPMRAFLLADEERKSLDVTREEDALAIRIPVNAPDEMNSIVVLDVSGRADVNRPPLISAAHDIFVDSVQVEITSDREHIQIRYTVDGDAPSNDSPEARGPLTLYRTTTIFARIFRDGKAVSEVSRRTFTRVTPRPAERAAQLSPGIHYEYFEGDWNTLPEFDEIGPVKSGILPQFDFSPRRQEEHFAFRYRGFIQVPDTGVYTFYLDSDDGSRLCIGDELIVDNDGLHGMFEKSGVVALSAGLHEIKVCFFEKTGGDGLTVSYGGPGIEKVPVPATVLMHME